MDASISPVNITAAAVITQLLLIVIMVVGAAILKRGEPWSPVYHQATSRFPWTILLLSIITIGALVFSKELTPIWQPLFGGAPFPGVSSSVALFLMFTLDSVCVASLVWFTGGSRQSAFGPVFFILPALAIFLREPLVKLFFYVVLVGVLFSFCLLAADSPHGRGEGTRTDRVAYWFVAIACLLLTTFVGYLTRPR